MANLPRELGQMGYGKDLANALAQIGNTLGQAKRQKDAQELITQFQTEAFKPNTTIEDLMKNSKILGLMNQLGTTDEGHKALSDFSSLMNFTNSIGDQARKGLIEGKPGTDIISTETSTTGEITPKKTILSVPAAPKYTKEDVPASMYDALGIKKEELKSTLSGAGGAKSELTLKPQVEMDQFGQPKLGMDGKPSISYIKLAQQSLPNTPTAGGGRQKSTIDTSKIDWTLEGEEFLNQPGIDQKTREQVRLLTKKSGATIQELTGVMGAGGTRGDLMAIGGHYDPEFKTANTKALMKSVDSYAAGGKDATRLVSLNNATGHLGELDLAAKALHNFDPAFFNALKNQYGKNLSGAPPIRSFMTSVGLIMGELEKAITDKATVAQLQKMEEGLTQNLSPDAFKKVFHDLADMILTRYGTEANQFAATTKYPPSQTPGLISPEAENVLERMGLGEEIKKARAGGVGRGMGTQTKVINGKTYVKAADGWHESSR